MCILGPESKSLAGQCVKGTSMPYTRMSSEKQGRTHPLTTRVALVGKTEGKRGRGRGRRRGREGSRQSVCFDGTLLCTCQPKARDMSSANIAFNRSRDINKPGMTDRVCEHPRRRRWTLTTNKFRTPVSSYCSISIVAIGCLIFHGQTLRGFERIHKESALKAMVYFFARDA